VFLPNFSTESGAIVRALPREGDRDRPAMPESAPVISAALPSSLPQPR
jgi:hypothetical protein